LILNIRILPSRHLSILVHLLHSLIIFFHGKHPVEVVLQVIALQLTRCQSGGSGGGSGGPHTFGYDASSSCTKPRAGRAHHEDLPCDFRRQNWCSVAGSSYPWYFIHLCFISSASNLFSRLSPAWHMLTRARFIFGKGFDVISWPSKWKWIKSFLVEI